MQPSFVNSKYGRIDSQRLYQIEQKYGFDFPISYKLFLLEVNGGVPQPDLFLTKYLGPQWVTVFFGVEAKTEPKQNPIDLVEMIDYFWAGEGPYLIPFAGDGVGNHFCICVKEPLYGKVYFWDRNEYTPDVMPEENNIDLVSDDFTQFLESASEFHPEETSFERLLRLKNYEGAWKMVLSHDLDPKSRDYLNRKPVDIAFDYAGKNNDRENSLLKEIIRTLESQDGK